MGGGMRGVAWVQGGWRFWEPPLFGKNRQRLGGVWPEKSNFESRKKERLAGGGSGVRGLHRPWEPLCGMEECNLERGGGVKFHVSPPMSQHRGAHVL